MGEKQRVIAYVDGFNFYFGLKSRKWRKYYWLDYVRFFESQIRSYQELVEVNYFSARPLDNEKADRQDLLFTANRLNPKFKLHLGKYLKKDKQCPYCSKMIHSFEELYPFPHSFHSLKTGAEEFKPSLLPSPPPRPTSQR